jgi:hypothetical protein
MTVVATLCISSAAHAQRQQCVEFSEDGWQCAMREAAGKSQGNEGAIAGAGANLPFGTEPDWFNNLRRQVGALQIADMNGDNLPDLVVGCYISNSFPPYPEWRNLIYYNTGTALEAQPSWVSADQVHTGDIQIADINNDTFPDILSVNGGSAHSRSVIYYGSATGPDNVSDVMLNNLTSSWNLSAAVFDIDHDSDLDIIITNQSGITGDNFRPLYLYRNNAGVIETTPSWHSDDAMISNGIDVGDYDGDGWEDLIIAKWVNFEAGIYKNINGTPQTLPVWTTGDDGGARGALIADIDDNGWNDVFFGYDPTRQYSNNSGTLAQAWESAAPFPSAQDIKLLDIDGDGDLDLAEAHFSTGRAHIYLSDNGTLPTAPTWTYDATQVANAIAFGDINGDDILDVAVGYSGDVSVRVFYGRPMNDCLPDVNQSGAVDADDLTAVILAWGPCPAPPATCDADVDDSGEVDADDLVAVILAWGPCP